MSHHVSVCKIFTFHAAHHDEEATDKCGGLHGHTYRLEIEVYGPPLDGKRMLIHGDVLKSLYRNDIEPLVDHRNLNETCPTNPTMENVLLWLTGIVQENMPYLAPDTTTVRLRLWETPTMYAETRRTIQ